MEHLIFYIWWPYVAPWNTCSCSQATFLQRSSMTSRYLSWFALAVNKARSTATCPNVFTEWHLQLQFGGHTERVENWEIWPPTLRKTVQNRFWWLYIGKISSFTTSQSCRQHISSPTSVTNIDLADCAILTCIFIINSATKSSLQWSQDFWFLNFFHPWIYHGLRIIITTKSTIIFFHFRSIFLRNYDQKCTFCFFLWYWSDSFSTLANVGDSTSTKTRLKRIKVI